MARRPSTRCRLAQKTLHRARLTNLSQEEATDGCRRLSQRKIYCSAIQVSAWNRHRAERRPDPGEERPLVAALPGDEIPCRRWSAESAPRSGANTDTVVIVPPIRTLSGAMR